MRFTKSQPKIVHFSKPAKIKFIIMSNICSLIVAIVLIVSITTTNASSNRVDEKNINLDKLKSTKYSENELVQKMFCVFGVLDSIDDDFDLNDSWIDFQKSNINQCQ